MSEAQAKKPSLEDFELGEPLGRGAYGDVLLATKKSNGKKFAIKKIEKKLLVKEDKTKYAVMEREIMTKCEHPSIVLLYYSFRDKDNLYYVIELAPNGDLAGAIKKTGSFALPVAVHYAAEIVNALEYLHTTQGVIHRDLKPENILLSAKNHIKLTDFGTSKQVGQSRDARSDSFVGTAEYISPELLDVEKKMCYKSSDLWALGCIIYQMITGKFPFRGQTDLVTFEKILGGHITFPKNFPEDAKDLVSKLLVKDPDARLGANSYAELKAHKFFQGVAWDTLTTVTPPEFAPYPEELDWAVEEAPPKPIWQDRLHEGETVVIEGQLSKRAAGGQARRRVGVVTSESRILYFSTRTKKLIAKISLLFSTKTIAVGVSGSTLELILPTCKYELEFDDDDDAGRWLTAIEKLKKKATKKHK